MEKLIGLLILISLLSFGVYFLDKGKIGGASFCTLIGVTLVCGLAFHGFDRLKELDIKNLRLILSEIEETKKEIFAKQEDLKKTALTMSKIMAFSNSVQGRIGSEEGYKVRREWYDHKLNQLIQDFDFSEIEKREIQKFSEKYKEIDRLLDGRGGLKTTDPDYEEIKEKLEQLSEEIIEMQESDINK